MGHCISLYVDYIESKDSISTYDILINDEKNEDKKIESHIKERVKKARFKEKIMFRGLNGKKTKTI